MTQEELQIEFDKNKDSFDIVKKRIESDIVRSENFRGEFYEIFPYSYQRGGFQQGKPIVNMNLIKNMKSLYTYGFNSKDVIIEVREGSEIKESYYYQFLFYEKEYIKSFYFDDKILQNIQYYFLDKEGNISIMYSKGKRGGRTEYYFYNKSGYLDRIVIDQFDRKGDKRDTLQHTFEYNVDGSLKSIIESSPDGEYSEIIWIQK